MYYIHKDYPPMGGQVLGSFQAITDEDGELVEKHSFDPWGRRRNPTDWTFNNVPNNYLFDRGYTGHEHLDQLGVINMNGRVGACPERRSRFRNPTVARFLSPDPFVQNSSSTQGFNRYSYVSNNPLKFTDPSGYQHGNHPMTAANYITVNNAAYELVGGGAIGPMHGNYWSNAYGFGGHGGYGSSGGNGGHYSNDNSGFIPIYTNNSASGAYYNQNNGLYYTADGMIISAQQAQNGYANYSLEVSWLFFAGTNANPYQTFIGAQFNNGTTTWFNQQATSDHNGSLSREGQAGGGLTWGQAKAHYQFGGGTPVHVDLNSIDLSRVSLSDFNDRGLATIRLDFINHFSNTNDALVHGTIMLQLTGDNTAQIALNSGENFPQLKGQPAGMYDFKMQSWGNAVNWIRNPVTFFGGLINGTFMISGSTGPLPIYTGGTPFPIYYHGTVTIP